MSIERSRGEVTKRVHSSGDTLADGSDFLNARASVPEARDSNVNEAGAPGRMRTDGVRRGSSDNTTTYMPSSKHISVVIVIDSMAHLLANALGESAECRSHSVDSRVVLEERAREHPGSRCKAVAHRRTASVIKADDINGV